MYCNNINQNSENENRYNVYNYNWIDLSRIDVSRFLKDNVDPPQHGMSVTNNIVGFIYIDSFWHVNTEIACHFTIKNVSTT